ncbi:MAG: hypothetical protein OHK0011_05070 [Turneriella sp.]
MQKQWSGFAAQPPALQTGSTIRFDAMSEKPSLDNARQKDQQGREETFSRDRYW